MVVCAAKNCCNSSRLKEMRFFKFPSEGARRAIWMKNSALETEPGPFAKLCAVGNDDILFMSATYRRYALKKFIFI